MPEGLDQATDAFRSEIAPGSQSGGRPRDEAGRFTARPETMFEERPVEGDPLTGDTRDGGDDARLAAAERRIADGRAEEGDEAELRRSANDNFARANDNNTARARNAAADGRHERQEAEPERIGEQSEQHDQDAEGEDGKPKDQGDAERDAEQDAGPKYTVQVDGQPVEVSLTEALAGYQREAVFHRRMSQIAEARRTIEQEASTIAQARDAYVQKLNYADQLLAEMTPPEPPDWDREFAADPHTAREKQKAYAAIYAKRRQIDAERQQTAQQAAAEYDQNARRYAVEQFTQFVQEANIPDEKALTREMSEMRAYAKDVGFNEGEIATVYDRRMLRVLRDAALYRRMTADKPKPVMPGKGKTLAPGVASPVGSVTRRSLDEAMTKLAKTGRLDDASLVFQRLIR